MEGVGEVEWARSYDGCWRRRTRFVLREGMEARDARLAYVTMQL